MTFKKKDYYTIVQQAQDAVPGFRVAYPQFKHHFYLFLYLKGYNFHYFG